MKHSGALGSLSSCFSRMCMHAHTYMFFSDNSPGCSWTVISESRLYSGSSSLRLRVGWCFSQCELVREGFGLYPTRSVEKSRTRRGMKNPLVYHLLSPSESGALQASQSWWAVVGKGRRAGRVASAPPGMGRAVCSSLIAQGPRGDCDWF